MKTMTMRTQIQRGAFGNHSPMYTAKAVTSAIATTTISKT